MDQIVRPKIADTPSAARIIKETLGISRINPPSARGEYESWDVCNLAPGLLSIPRAVQRVVKLEN
jgi:hypothetical protein